ncbi:MAG: energy transducer TonB [Acidobacteriota bacterium]
MNQRAFAVLAFLSTLLLASPLGASDANLATEVTLLVGHPGQNGGSDQGVLMVPGAVIPVRADSGVDRSSASQGPDAQALQAEHQRISAVARDLAKSLRLSSIDISYRTTLRLDVEAPRDLFPPKSASEVRLSVELLGFNADVASYEVKFFEGSKPLTDTPLTVHRGQQAVVGGLNGPDAPYLFLVIAPAGEKAVVDGGPAKPVVVDGDIKPPLPIEKTPPVYTAAAKEAGVEGVVIVEAIIEADGVVSEVTVLKGLPHGLSEAAAEAIEHWRFEPAELDGEPVQVRYNLTINFRLPDKKKEDLGA